MPTAARRLTTALAVALVLCGCSTRDGDDPLADTSRVTEVPRPTPAQPSDADRAPPDPAPPDPAPPDPAPPDPAPPDPAPPDPAPPAPDPGAVEAAQQEEAAEAASLTDSPMAVACDEVVAALTEAVLTYETVALAEGGGGGDRSAAAADMRAAWQEARRAADRMGAGLPSAAGPAFAAITALHDGLGTRAVLDESDADPWRQAREELQRWCQAHD